MRAIKSVLVVAGGFKRDLALSEVVNATMLRHRKQQNILPQRLTRPLKRDDFKQRFHFPTINFQGDMLVFRGVKSKISMET